MSIVAVEVSRVTAVYPMHEFDEIALGGLHYQVVVIVHEHVTVDENTVAVMIVF